MILTEKLSYTYAPGGVFEKKAVKNVSFTIEKGVFCGIIGHTGSGKSTLLQMLAGLVEPTAGRLSINGTDVTDKKMRRTNLKGKVGFVFQYPEHQLFGETVLEDVMFGPKNLGCSDEEAEKKAVQALHDTGVESGVFQKSPFELSGGQKRRVAIAGVLALSPEILILDEPTAGLDPVGREEILNCVSALHKREKMTILLVSHNMEDMAKYAERILVMHEGKLVLDGSAEEVFSQGEQLRDLGLDIPEITHVILGLRAKGINISEKIYTVEAAKEAILHLWEA